MNDQEEKPKEDVSEPPSAGAGYTSYYTEQDASRKTALIQKKFFSGGVLSVSEGEELADLKNRSAKRRDEIAPLAAPYFLENNQDQSPR